MTSLPTLLILVAFLFTQTIDAQTGTYFKLIDRVYLSKDAWLLSYSISLEPYKEHLSELLREVTFFRDSVSFLRNPNVTKRDPYKKSVLAFIDQ